MNPFFQAYNTPFEIPPFSQIKPEHILPAFEKGLAEEISEYEAIEHDPAPPTFVNTLEAMERSGALLEKVLLVFYNLVSAHTNEELNAINREIGPKYSKHNSRLRMSETIFARIDALYQKRAELNLEPEQLRLLEERHTQYIRAGVQLPPEEKAQLQQILADLAEAKIAFQQNLLKDTNASQLHLTQEDELDGLPADIVQAAADLAAKENKLGWLFTANQGTLYSFLTYSTHSHLRKQLYSLYIERCNNGNEYDNNELALRIARLRLQQAQLLGYKNFAEYSLANTMAKTSTEVRSLLDRVCAPALEKAKKERQILQEMITDGSSLQAWDWWFYAEQVREKQYNLSSSTLRPYFPLDSVRDGAFAVAHKLFGIRFVERHDLPLYHEDVRTFEVQEADGTLIGIFYVDYFARSSKQGGAWMSVFRGQSALDVPVLPIVINTCNFPPPTEGAPCLLTPTEVRTLFHEFGHALHGLLSHAKYPTLSGTSVPRDYVEFPSQIMENWGRDRRVIREFAKHYKDSSIISEELLDKLDDSGLFNMGFATTEYLAASYLDMAWHELEDIPENSQDFERQVLKDMGLIDEIAARYRTTYFAHIFASGYAAGYYSYMWSEVLDSDGFSLFEEKGLFHQESAQKLRVLVYSAGNTADVMQQYIAFRGTTPQVDALLRKRGFLGA